MSPPANAFASTKPLSSSFGVIQKAPNKSAPLCSLLFKIEWGNLYICPHHTLCDSASWTNDYQSTRRQWTSKVIISLKSLRLRFLKLSKYHESTTKWLSLLLSIEIGLKIGLKTHWKMWPWQFVSLVFYSSQKCSIQWSQVRIQGLIR